MHLVKVAIDIKLIFLSALNLALFPLGLMYRFSLNFDKEI